MAHKTLRTGYDSLADRINRFPQGAPPRELLFRILEVLFSEREADLVSKLPLRPFTVRRASRVWGVPAAEAERVLDELADRGLLVDLPDPGSGRRFVLPPPMAGFFEFSLMRIREDIDQKVLSKLFHEYINVEEDFIVNLFSGSNMQFGRMMVYEPGLEGGMSLHVLDHEKASEVVKSASCIGVGLCYCRHKMHHLDKSCDAPLDICMTFNTVARSLTDHGIARQADAAECLDLLARAWDLGLVQFGENARTGVNFICNCCKCCCEAMIAARRFGHLSPVHTSGFAPAIDGSMCAGCGRCVEACPVEAVSLAAGDEGGKGGAASIDMAQCLGCGLCVKQCSRNAVRLERAGERLLTPVNSIHRTVLMAVERGTLQNLVFDNPVSTSHRALGALLGAILKLPPVKRVLASRQLNSRYLDALLARVKA